MTCELRVNKKIIYEGFTHRLIIMEIKLNHNYDFELKFSEYLSR